MTNDAKVEITKSIFFGRLSASKPVDFVFENCNEIEELGFEIDFTKITVDSEQKELKINWRPVTDITPEIIEKAVRKGVVTWMDIGRSIQTFFKVTAIVDGKTLVWNVYLTCSVQN